MKVKISATPMRTLHPPMSKITPIPLLTVLLTTNPFPSGNQRITSGLDLDTVETKSWSVAANGALFSLFCDERGPDDESL